MIAIFDTATGMLEQVVTSTDGIDLTGKDTTAAPDDWQDSHEWDLAGRVFVVGAFLQQREIAKQQVDAAAEAIYACVGKAGVIGSVVHPIKALQAKEYINATTPIDTDYPLLLSEVGITGNTIYDVAVAINAKSEEAESAVRAAALIIDPIRLLARSDVDQATSLSEIAAVVYNVKYPEI